MQKVILNTCFIGAMFVACGDVGESYQVEKFGNSRINVLYQGEGMGKILKVTANRGNCKIYDNNYKIDNFKNENTLVSGKESPKFCYSDIRKTISSMISSTEVYSCSGLEYYLNKLSTLRVNYKNIPYTKKQQEDFYAATKAFKKMLSLNEEARKIKSEVKKVWFISDYLDYRDYDQIVKIEQIWKNWKNNEKNCIDDFCVDVEPYHAYYLGETYELDKKDKDLVDRYFTINKEFHELFEFIQQDNIKALNLHSVYDGIIRIYYTDQMEEAWLQNKAYNRFKPYTILIENYKLNQEEINTIKKLEKQLYYDYYVELKYGNKASFNVKDCSEILEVEITTDKGSATYKF